MLNNSIIMILFSTIIIILFCLNYLLSIIKKYNRNKISPFECGFNPQSNSRLPFSNNFFLIMLMFLIFDVEIILIIPSIFLIKYLNSIFFLTLLFFLLILIISLIIEWLMNLLNWTF